MWQRLAGHILRSRVLILIVLGLATAFMAYKAQDVRMSYKFGRLLPQTDSTYLAYKNFTSQFGEDGNVLVIGASDSSLFEVENFRKWYFLADELKKISVPKDTIVDGASMTLQKSAVDSVFSIAHCYSMRANKDEQQFEFFRLMQNAPQNQQEVDSIMNQVYQLPFYEGLLYQDGSPSTLMMVFVDSDLFNSEDRGESVELITQKVDTFTEETGIRTYLSGMPFIRSNMTTKVKAELRFFVILAAIVTAFLLLLFFRSLSVVLVSMIVVSMGVTWSLGLISLFNYEISMLMGLIPPLMIVIGVPNCIYLLNKYHGEYKKHGNQAKALTRMIQKVGDATFLTNTTTALGFATFIFTKSDVIREFGVIASINIICLFFISILTIPSVYSFMPGPQRKHVRHLDRRWVFLAVNQLVEVVQGHRRVVYIALVLVLGASIFGATKVKTTGNIVSDFPSEDRVIKDMQWFESSFNGALPFEILVDCGKKGQITQPRNLKKIEELQELLSTYEEFSRSVSITDAAKFAKQAFYNGDSSRYTLLTKQEGTFMRPYFTGAYETRGLESTFLDSTKKMTRVSAQIKDIGTDEMQVLMADLMPKVDEIFPPEKYDITVTGTSIVFLEGTEYMVKNLFISLAIAICLIAVIMSFLFRSARMVLISLLPNFIPLLFTAAIMGYFSIALKPSTILVFSIAFGISVDDTIHFLAKYRQELRVLKWNIRKSVLLAVKETGVSMMYTSIVLFFGFSLFGWSEFDGTRALGILVSVTLLVAMLSNLVLLPSLLLSLERSITTKAFSEPLLEIIDEEEDIELEELQVRRMEPPKEVENQD